jgi:HEAT repeat protein
MEPLAALVDKLPAQDPAGAEPIIKALIQGGPAVIAQLIGQVGEQFGDPAGVKATYALHGITHYASRAGAEAERKMVAEALARALEAKHSVDLKSFLCQQLQWCGGAEQVPALAKLLTDEALCEPATQALAAIGGADAVVALRAALPKVQGPPRVTIINALGRFRDLAAADEIRRSVAAADPNLRRAAWYALGNIGDAAAAKALLQAAEGEASFDRTQATDACLRLAHRLGELGRRTEAEGILLQLLARREGPADGHDRLAVLEGFIHIVGEAALPGVTAALASQDLQYRTAAARLALDLVRAIQKALPGEAERLLERILEATKEEAVHRQAEQLLSEAGRRRRKSKPRTSRQ